jgi:hypothetical protein
MKLHGPTPAQRKRGTGAGDLKIPPLCVAGARITPEEFWRRPVHPTFKCDLFKDYTAESLADSRKCLLTMMEALTQIDQRYLRRHPETPGLYSKDALAWRRAGWDRVNNLKYIPEVNTEEWLDVPNTIREGGGDCFPMSQRIIVRSKSTNRYEIIALGELRFVYGDYEALSYSFQRLRFEFKPITDFIDKGVKPIFKMHLSNGTDVSATEDHKFWALDRKTSRGSYDLVERCLGEYAEAMKLKKGPRTQRVRILQAARIPVLNAVTSSPAEVYLHGIYAAEGYFDGKHTCISQYKPAVRAKIEEALAEVGTSYRYQPPRGKTEGSGAYYSLHGGVDNPIVAALRAQGHNSFDMQFPTELLSGSEDLIEQLVTAHGDGDAYRPKETSPLAVRRRHVYGTSSETLAEQLRLGMLLLGRPFHLARQDHHGGAGDSPIYRLYEYQDTAPKMQQREERLQDILPGMRYGCVRSVTPAGHDRVGCITVDDNHNFVLADGTLAKNCEDWGCWLAAEYREGRITGNHVAAQPYILWRKLPSGNYRFHGITQIPEEWVEDADGSVRLKPAQLEDPSAKTGMLEYYDYLMGNTDKAGSARLFEQRAKAEEQLGNPRAAETIRLRIKQLFERVPGESMMQQQVQQVLRAQAAGYAPLFVEGDPIRQPQPSRARPSVVDHAMGQRPLSIAPDLIPVDEQRQLFDLIEPGTAAVDWSWR